MNNNNNKFQSIKTEFLGGLAGAVSSLPQSMAYGVIAFAPLGSDYTAYGAIAGVYSSIIGGMISSLCGSAKIMVSGSRAATGVIFAALLTQILTSSSLNNQQALAVAFLAVLLSGLLQLGLGLIKVGHLVKFVPQTVIAGFLNGSGLLILAGQIQPLTGLKLTQLLTFSDEQWANFQWGALGLGLITSLVMHYSRKIAKNAPAGLVALVVGTLIYHALPLYICADLRLGGTFPNVSSVLPSVNHLEEIYQSLLQQRLIYWLNLALPAALSIAVISSLDSLLSAAALDGLTLGRTNGNRELIGQGLGNIAAALFAATPSSGSIGRSGAVYQAGGRDRRSVLFNAGILILMLWLLAPWLGLLPKAVVAGVLLVIGLQLFDGWTIKMLQQEIASKQWTDFRADLLVIAAVVTATLIWNLIIAVGLGILLAVIHFVRRMSRSVIRRQYLGNHVHSRQLRDEKLSSLLEQHGNRIGILELDGAIFFGSGDGLEMEIERMAKNGVDYFVLDMKRIKDIDSSGAFILQRIYQRLQQIGKCFVISYIPKERRSHNNNHKNHHFDDRRFINQDRQLWQLLRNYGFIETTGEELFFPDTDSALAACETLLLKDLEKAGILLDEFNAYSTGIFSGLHSTEIEVIKPLLKTVSYSNNSLVFNQGEQGDALYMVSKGMFNVMITIPGGRQKRILSVSPGAVFGEMALMDGEPRAATVVASEDSECLCLSRQNFEVLMSEYPHIALKIFAKMGVMFARRLRAANLLISELEA